MEITGIITHALPVREGTTKTGAPWKIATYVVETVEQYPKHLCFDVSDGSSGRIERLNIQLGEKYTIYFDIDAHSTTDGRWFNSIRAYDARRAE